jgi:outer membrane receptor for monomeric catechols
MLLTGNSNTLLIALKQPNLQPIKTQTYEVGLEMQMFKRRLDLMSLYKTSMTEKLLVFLTPLQLETLLVF